MSLAVTDDEIIAGQQSMIAPTDLFKVTLKKSKIKQITEFNEEILKKLDKPTVEQRWVETTDGKQTQTLPISIA